MAAVWWGALLVLACFRWPGVAATCAPCRPPEDGDPDVEALVCARKDPDPSCSKRAGLADSFAELTGLGSRRCDKEPALRDCPGSRVACAVDRAGDLDDSACRAFAKSASRLADVDPAVAEKLLDRCRDDPAAAACTREDKLNCLRSRLEALRPDCRRRVLRLSDVRQDGPLLSACAQDRRRLCPDGVPDEAATLECLAPKKAAVSKKCREQLLRRQKLIAQDYRASRGLAKACREDVRTYHCRRGVSEDKNLRLAQILLCLESATKNDSKLSPECRAELKDHRRMLLEDFRLSPEIVADCHSDIERHCSPIEFGGKTIHCLMERARRQRNGDGRIEPACQRALEALIEETDAGEDWTVDPILRRACKPVVDAGCSEIEGGEGKVMSCLVEKLDAPIMTEECGAAVMQIQYFVARDFKLDPQLYRACKKDAVAYCNAKKGWIDDEGQMDPERGPLVLPCLFRHAYKNEVDARQLSPICLREVKRVMRQRAVSVDLQPEIEEACMDDLALYCFEKTAKGEEMSCLQNRLETLNEKCRLTVGNFTEAQAGHVELNPVVLVNCRRVMEQFCPAVFRNGVDEGDVMECLVSHKNDPEVRSDTKCRAAIEHFQLISLKNYRFTYKFKQACRSYVMRYCPKAKTKSEVIYCLSETVRNDILEGNRPIIPKDCRQQLRTQLFQQRENIDFDPKLAAACKVDLASYCSKVEHGASRAIECLQNARGKLSDACQNAIFNIKKQELTDNALDYNLITTCTPMIGLFCKGTNSSKVLDCLKLHKEESSFDEKCKLIVVHRMIDQNSDYRLNPALHSSCNLDIKKFCSTIVADEPQDKELQGKVIGCLKVKFRDSKLSGGCERQVASMLREQALNYHLDPLLSTMCHMEIATVCRPADESDTAADGQVEECLKRAFLRKRIVSEECRTEVASLIEEARADIQADPLLQRACALDLVKWCGHVEPGNGRHVKCLKIVLADETKELDDECASQLTKRIEMFKSAAVIMVPEDFRDLYDQVATSPAKNYFLVASLTLVGIVFVMGLFCGRVTRRAKNAKRK